LSLLLPLSLLLSLLFPSPIAYCLLPIAIIKERNMKYDEDLMVELIATGELTHAKIAEQLDVSRRTVWRIANGLSRPDLQRKITDTVEGMRQATTRFAARRMEKLLEKQMEVALGEGETARKSREFMIKTFMVTIPAQADKVASKPPPPRGVDTEEKFDGLTLYNNLFDLSPELKKQVVEELCGPGEAPEPPPEKKPEKEPEPTKEKDKKVEKEVEDKAVKKKKFIADPFEHIHTVARKIIQEAKEKAAEEDEIAYQRNMRRRNPKPM
jgi:hypothetical protein